MRLTAYIITLILVAVLSGCGSGGDVVSGADPGTSNDQGNSTSGPTGADTTATTTTSTDTTTTTSTDTTTTSTDTTTTNTTDTNTTDTNTTDTDTSTTGSVTSGVDDIRQEMLAAINQARSTARVCGTTHFDATTPVRWNDKIAAAALLHSVDMATNNFFNHTGSDNSSAGSRLTREGYAWVTYGENLAGGYSSVTAVFQTWLSSAGHCKNIMAPAFTEIGAAYARNSAGPYSGFNWTVWTLDMGTSAR